MDLPNIILKSMNFSTHAHHSPSLQNIVKGSKFVTSIASVQGQDKGMSVTDMTTSTVASLCHTLFMLQYLNEVAQKVNICLFL